MIRVVVSGLGKMGREILNGLSQQEDIEPIGILEKFSVEEVYSLPDGSGRLIPCSADPSLLERLTPDVMIDFTVPVAMARSSLRGSRGAGAHVVRVGDPGSALAAEIACLPTLGAR